MEDTENPEALTPPRVARFGEGAEGKSARRERSRGPARASIPARLSQFLRDIRRELKNVSWPSATDVKNTTIITIIAVIFFAVYLFGVDQLWSFLLTQLSHLIEWLSTKLGG
jgi:preprotein translocase SecE subunit